MAVYRTDVHVVVVVLEVVVVLVLEVVVIVVVRVVLLAVAGSGSSRSWQRYELAIWDRWSVARRKVPQCDVRELFTALAN